MWESLLGLLGTLAALLLWWWRRRAARHDDPYEQHRKKFTDIDREIATTPPRHPGALRGGLANDLDELDRLSQPKGDRRRSSGDSR